MRTQLLLTMTLLAGIDCLAQSQIAITKENLTDWTVIGKTVTASRTDSGFTLAPATQLAHSFAASDCILHLVAQPVIGEDSSDWPVVEIGSLAIVFSRHELQGQIIFVSGSNASATTPIIFPLDSAGRSSESLDMTFSYRGAELCIKWNGKEQKVSVDADTDDFLSVVFSSGGTIAWTVDQADFTFLKKESVTVSSTGGTAMRPEVIQSSIAQAPLNGALANPPVSKTADAPQNPEGKDAAAPTGSSSTLEVFTPPSVRVGRVDLARSVAAQLKNQ